MKLQIKKILDLNILLALSIAILMIASCIFQILVRMQAKF